VEVEVSSSECSGEDGRTYSGVKHETSNRAGSGESDSTMEPLGSSFWGDFIGSDCLKNGV
jgi:hypothetical protein